ncbi:intradiol ring-cleavage dioxygenase [Streptomyces xanthophaeus]|uniref:dioxygenase family protein n=1 Tax=Streptomyces xanthophaeus TaxID=67385 RepID=UPI001F331766|nr:intradiol ring-cleavage dioxygenase [Streptomyces xanthophaeus]WST26493.1 intradiol ring-cleavage dioxygenase [Streptomyces xanthophaeus]WST58535.1 intradiol ring-cleavage dioxygenase [Streptomyces xanthophaeus]
MAENPTTPTSRRAVLLAAGSAAVAALATACGTDSTALRTTRQEAPERAAPHPATATPGCVLTTEWGAGPNYLDLDRVRSDITGGREGVPFRLELTVVRASEGCRPVRGAAVDLWQADAQGAYSNARDGYLRGTQLTDAAGRAVFRTIVPGWYAHLAPHIHFKVRPDARTQTSSHFFFPEDLLQQLYARQPYARRTAPKHPNGRDGRYRESGAALTLAPVADGAGYRAAYTVGIA